MMDWIVTNKDLLTTLAALAALGLSIFNMVRNHSLGLPKIKIKATPLKVILTNYSDHPDEEKLYLEFEVINKSLFPVTIKESCVRIKGKWVDAEMSKSNDRLPTRIDSRDVLSFTLKEGNGDIPLNQIEKIRVMLSDDKKFSLSKRAIHNSCKK